MAADRHDECWKKYIDHWHRRPMSLEPNNAAGADKHICEENDAPANHFRSIFCPCDPHAVRNPTAVVVTFVHRHHGMILVWDEKEEP